MVDLPKPNILMLVVLDGGEENVDRGMLVGYVVEMGEKPLTTNGGPHFIGAHED